MTIERAIAILDPEYTEDVLAGWNQFRSFEAINEACTVAVAALRAQQDGLSNDPLTLEQLREMDGEPVWIVSKDLCKGSCWMLVDVEYELCREAHGGMAVFENNGKTWLAYRRKPEDTNNG